MEQSQGEINHGLAQLGYTSIEQLKYAEIITDAHASGAHVLAKSADGRMTRSSILRDWFEEIFEVFKTRGNSDTDCLYYCRPRYPRLDKNGYLPANGDGVVFEELSYADMKARIISIHKALFRKFTASPDLNESVKTVTSSITDLIDGPDGRYIYIGIGYAVDRGELTPENGEYKDDFKLENLNKYFADNGELRKELPRVFYRLFDTSAKAASAQNDVVQVPPITLKMMTTLRKEYNTTLKWLNTSDDPARRPEIPNKLQEINDWACNFQDRYMDIIHMASSRLKKHDYGVYFLTGRGRNGKSSCIDLVASMYGTNNICRVSVDDLGDSHNLHNFKRALVNLPDEQKLQNEQQKVMSGEAVKAFRIAAAHSSDNMSVMRSNKSDVVDYSFVTIAPVNRIPNFPSEEKAACIDRSRIIEFQGNFSASDKLAVKWGKVHFTPEFMMRFTGQALAYASYFSNHAWVMTQMMKMAQDKQYENSASNVTYMKMWERVFCGFDSYRTLFDDYENYCKLMDVEKTEFGRNSILLVQYNSTGTGTDRLAGKYRYHYNDFLREEQASRKRSRGDKDWNSPNIMYKRTVFTIKDPDNNGNFISITGGKTIEDFHNSGGSIIFELEDRGYFEKLEKQDKQQTLGGADGLS